MLSFLANRYAGTGHGKVMNWVIGNEINARKEWNYIEYMETEAIAVVMIPLFVRVENT